MITSRLRSLAPFTRFAYQARAHSLYSTSTGGTAHAHTPCATSGSVPWSRLAAVGGAALALSASITGRHAVYAEAAGVVEPETGVHYPGTGPGGRTLAGTSVRKMGGLVSVYSVGLYVRTHAVRLAAESAAVTEVSDEVFWDAVCERAQPLLRLVVVREVNGDHMATGFERGLARAAKRKRPTVPMKQFAALFKHLGNMKVGSEMLIECCGESGLVELTVDGRLIGSVVDKHLATTLPAMYLAKNAVTPELRTHAEPTFKQILAH